MVFVKIIEKEINGSFVFPLQYVILDNNKHVVYKESDVYKKSIKKKNYNEESAILFLNTLQQLYKVTNYNSNNRFRTHNQEYEDGKIIEVKTVLLPQNPDVLKDYIRTLKNLDKNGYYNTYSILSKGAPIYGNNGKEAANEMIIRTINKQIDNINTDFLGMQEQSRRNTRISKISYNNTNDLFDEFLKKTYIFLAFNDFIEHSENTENLKNFLLDKKNIERIKGNVVNGIIPKYSNTDKLINTFYNYDVKLGHSFLYPTTGSDVFYKNIEILPKASLIFWINNWDHEFLYKKNDNSKKILFDIWLEYVKKRDDNLDISISSINNELLKKFSLMIETNSILNDKLPQNDVVDSSDRKIVVDVKNSFADLIKDRSIKIVFQAILINNPDFVISKDMSYQLLYCLAKTTRSPGIFRKNGGTKGVIHVILDTLSVYSYDLSHLEDILLFLGTNDDTPNFSNKQWTSFILAMKKDGITKENGNLGLFASIYIDQDKGKNITAKGKISSREISFIGSLV